MACVNRREKKNQKCPLIGGAVIVDFAFGHITKKYIYLKSRYANDKICNDIYLYFKVFKICIDTLFL